MRRKFVFGRSAKLSAASQRNSLQTTAENCSRESNNKMRIMFFAEVIHIRFALIRG